MHPPQAEGVYAFTQNKKKWEASTGPERYRRGLYTMFFRSAPHPLFATFDTPDFQSVCTRRGRSDTPLQALMMANDQAFFELAQGLAARAAREAASRRGGSSGPFGWRFAGRLPPRKRRRWSATTAGSSSGSRRTRPRREGAAAAARPRTPRWSASPAPS